QAVPSATEPPRSTHASRPVAQLVCPAWQGKPDGAQALPAVHAPHTPPWQARPDPQAAPSATAFPLSAQVEAPVAHEVTPVWQGLAELQALPETQATHDPPPHT